MGAWGNKALESDEGLDVVDFVKNHVADSTGPVALNLAELIAQMIEEGFLAEDFDDIDFFYDNSAMALSELYLMFKEKGTLEYNDEDENLDLTKKVTSFIGDKDSIAFLLHYLRDIKNEVPDEDGEREIVSLRKESDHFALWQENINNLIVALEQEIK